MKRNPSDDELLRRYFLGEMSQEEAEELEKRFGDDQFFELAEAVEGDLLAAAARGELAPAERERILKRLASSPQGRERLAFIRTLNKAADEEKRATPNVVRFPDRIPASRPVSQWVTALAASLLVTAGLTWYVIQKDNGIEAQYAEAPQQAQENRDVPPKNHEKQPVAGPVQPVPVVPDPVARQEESPAPEVREPAGRVVLQLALTTLRGEETLETLRITQEIGKVEIQLDVTEYRDFESFDVALRNQEHDPIWQESGLKPRTLDWASALVFEVPAEKLAAEGRYKVEVQGATAGEEPQDLSYVEFEVVTSGKP